MKKVYLNTGRGWQLDNLVSIPEDFSDGGVVGGADKAIRFADINGDDRVDMVRGLAANQRRVSLNKDGGYSVVSGTFPDDFEDTAHKNFGTQLADVNGDGQMDVVRGYYDSGTGTSTRKVYLKNGDNPDLLKEAEISWRKDNRRLPPSARYLTEATSQIRTCHSDANARHRQITVHSSRLLGDCNTTYDYQRGYYLLRRRCHSRQFTGLIGRCEYRPSTITKSYFHLGMKRFNKWRIW